MPRTWPNLVVLVQSGRLDTSGTREDFLDRRSQRTATHDDDLHANSQAGSPLERTRESPGYDPHGVLPRAVLNSRREVTPSFAKILPRCHSTVRRLMNSCPAISTFV